MKTATAFWNPNSVPAENLRPAKFVNPNRVPTDITLEPASSEKIGVIEYLRLYYPGLSDLEICQSVAVTWDFTWSPQSVSRADLNSRAEWIVTNAAWAGYSIDLDGAVKFVEQVVEQARRDEARRDQSR